MINIIPVFYLKNILERFVHKDARRDHVFCFSHGGKGLIDRLEEGVSTSIRLMILKKCLKTFLKNFLKK